MSIANKIARLTAARAAIREALADKGVTASTHGFESFAEDIGEISGGGEPTLQAKSATPGNSQQVIEADEGYDGLSKVTVSAIGAPWLVPSGTRSITANGDYDVTSYATASVEISDAPELQSKSVDPSESSQTVEPDTGYDGLSAVTVTGISPDYVGSGITERDSDDLTASGATVTAPAGYYSSSASKAVSSGSAATPATTITANPNITVGSDGTITATVSKTQDVTPTVSAGYVSSGTAGTITVSGTATGALTTQAAQTIHPSTSDQTISSGKYLTGTQTVKGVLLTNLAAENIKNGVTVEVGDSTDSDCVTSVTGTYEGSGSGTHGYTTWKNTSADESSKSWTIAREPKALAIIATGSPTGGVGMLIALEWFGSTAYGIYYGYGNITPTVTYSGTTLTVTLPGTVVFKQNVNYRIDLYY